MSGYFVIDEHFLVTDIVAHDYRTADVFRAYGINFCCGGRQPLNMACNTIGVDTKTVKKELENITRVINISPALPFHEWPVDFLTDYIAFVHHAYIRKALPAAQAHLENFALGHRKKFEYLTRLEETFQALCRSLLPHLQQEEEIIFPYIRQVSRAYTDNEPYAALLVRTLRKPLKEIMRHEHDTITRFLQIIRELSEHYTTPEKACISHKVAFQKLKEIDNDLVQHMHLENDILFPRAIEMEAELLQRN